MVNKLELKQFFGRFLMLFILGASIITVSVLANQFGPSPYLYTDDSWENADIVDPPGYNSSKWNIILDQHSHTLYSDGKLTVRQNIEWHIAMGFNAFFITDHNTVAHKEDIEELKEEYKEEGIIVMLGIEWTTWDIHMNFLGIEEWDDPIPNEPTDKEIQEAIEEAHDQGAIVVVNHLPWSINVANMEDHPKLDDLFDWGVDYVEIVNEDDYDLNSIQWYNELDPADQDTVGFITGTDMHSPGSVYGWTFLNATEFSEDAIMDELRAYRTNISYSSIGYEDEGEYGLNPLYVVLSPLMHFGGIFVPVWDDGIDWFKVSIFVGYFLSVFALLEVYRLVKPRFWKVIEKKKTRSETAHSS